MNWKKPTSATYVLNPQELHIWRARLDLSETHVAEYWPLLSRAEQARASRFKFAQHRRRFIIAKGILRTLLARYLIKPPAAINFIYNPFGKPELASRTLTPVLHFNSSDSNEMALYAITKTTPVGVDIEYQQKSVEAQAIAERFFADSEMEILRALPEEKKSAAFFAIWTRKEAFIKAVGEGLSFSLKKFAVNATTPAALLSVHEDINEASHWSIINLAPAEDYAGAVAIREHIATINYWDWD